MTKCVCKGFYKPPECPIHGQNWKGCALRDRLPSTNIIVNACLGPYEDGRASSEDVLIVMVQELVKHNDALAKQIMLSRQPSIIKIDSEW